MYLALLVAVLLLGLVGLAVYRWRSTRAQPLPAGPYPVVLVHGFFGFDELAILGRRFHYFRGVREALVEQGVDVHVVRLPALASVHERALALARCVEAMDAPRVNIIAHSMGGIDARYAIATLGIAHRVASLVTIGSPHRGTPLARAGQLLPARAMRAVLEKAGVSASATDWLTPEEMSRFNQSMPDAPQVYYASVVGRPRSTHTNLPLRTSRSLLARRAGTNDGIVPSASQAWGEVLFEVPADHWAQIGWSTSYDARPIYRDIVQRLRSRGL